MANLTVLQDGSEQIRYPNPALPLYVTRGNLRDLSGMAALCHWHEDVELLLPYHGYLRYNVNGRNLDIRENQGIFINARQLHYGYTADGTDCEYICITFRPQLLCANEAMLEQYIQPILTDPRLTHLVLESNIDSHRRILELMLKLDQLYQTRPAGYELQALGLLFSIWQQVFSLTRLELPNTLAVDAQTPIMRRMLEFIRTHYDERIRLDQIAAAGGVCRSSCCQLFKKHLGRTPNDYLNVFRLEKATELLTFTQMSVTEVSNSCGFSSSSYFTELFTRQKGCTPTAFRKNI